MSNRYNVAEITQMAMNMEEKGLAYYERAAAAAPNDKAKSIFLILAEQEKKHIDLFTELHRVMSEIQQINDSYLLDEQVSAYLKSIVDNTVFKDSNVANLKQVFSVKDAIHEGIQAEKNAILFYTELLKHAGDDSAANTIKLIIDEEKTHLVDLNNLLNSFRTEVIE